jgi:hypothetical protein
LTQIKRRDEVSVFLDIFAQVEKDAQSIPRSDY